jgi:hypothetical protein
MLIRLVAVLLLVGGGVGCGGDDDDATRPAGALQTTATVPETVDPRPPTGGYRLQEIATGRDSPVQTVALPGSSRTWIVEQPGRVVAIATSGGTPDVVLDLTDRVTSGGERGLLSLALHPRFPDDPRVYVHYSDSNGDTQVEELRVSDATIDPDPVRVLLEEDQPYSNHNGGSLAFGPDGLLYLGLGDGGSANDPEERAQDLSSRLGKLLRMDVDVPEIDWEIAAYGLRNPWRFAFDPQTGDAWIGDVGQSAREEVDVFPRGSGVLNFGWDAYEGSEEFDEDASEIRGSGDLTAPVAEYTHSDGCSITGGVVVRNPKLPSLDGRYIYGDYCSGLVWTVAVDGDRTARRERIQVPDLVSFDTHPDGTVYVTSQSGTVSQIVPE